MKEEEVEEQEEVEGECQRCVFSRAFHRGDARSCPHPKRIPASCMNRRAGCRADRANFALSHVRARAPPRSLFWVKFFYFLFLLFAPAVVVRFFF